MTIATAWRSGWCGKDNPPLSHKRCTGTAQGGELTCICDCHMPLPDWLRATAETYWEDARRLDADPSLFEHAGIWAGAYRALAERLREAAWRAECAR